MPWPRRSRRRSGGKTPSAHPSAGLWRTVFRIAAGELKARRRVGPERTEGTYEMNDLARDLVAALATLSEKQRAAVVLHHAQSELPTPRVTRPDPRYVLAVDERVEECMRTSCQSIAGSSIAERTEP
jgi:hypothetical protein